MIFCPLWFDSNLSPVRSSPGIYHGKTRGTPLKSVLKCGKESLLHVLTASLATIGT